jgi:glutamine synthetase
MGIPVKASHHEVSASQHEVDLHHTDALGMADGLTTFRLCVKEVARELGLYATFMPKPSESLAGSGMHLHLSLFDGDSNAFYSEAPDEPLSELGRSFLAGVLAHARELAAVTNQWVNSYKRLAAGFEAPEHVDWAREGVSSLVRVPSNRPGKEEAARIELRSPDPACNPYLTFALLLAAGLRGIERGYQLPAETNSNRSGAHSPAGSVGQHARPNRLPEDLREAIDAFDASELVRETLGDTITDWYVRNKRQEWAEYRRTVTELERRRLLPLL